MPARLERLPAILRRRRVGPALLLPRQRGVTALLAIMVFLAGLAAGSVAMVRDGARSWRSDVIKEITIELRPASDAEAADQIARAIKLATATPGVARARAITMEETAKLLAPWLGADADLRAIPVPRLVVVELSNPDADIAALRKAVAEQIRGARMDDHRGLERRLTHAADLVSAFGLAILAMVFAAAAISVAIATASAVHANREVVEVLHFVGARDRFILDAFQRSFLAAGAKGAAIGAGLAMLAFALLALRWGETASGAGTRLLPGPVLGFGGFLLITAVAVLVAVFAAFTSRMTARNMLRKIS